MIGLVERVADRIDLSALAFWGLPADERDAAFTELRQERPVSWHGPFESQLVEPEESTGGYWAIVRYPDVIAVSRAPETFCSGQGVLLDDANPEMLEASQSFIAMDAPRHTLLRGLVRAAFTPRQVARIEAHIEANATRIVDELAPLGECDFVEHVASRLPMMTISDLMGVPEEQRREVAQAANELVGWNDPEIVGDRDPLQCVFDGVMTLTAVALEMADARRAHPTEDLMTGLVQAEVDGHRLAEEEIAAFFVLLAVAGNDTSRHSTSHGLRALTEFPDQRAVLMADLEGRIGGAVEEIVRWATPVLSFRRTATRDTEIGGQEIREGEKVVLFYRSANRDEEAFTDPFRFDIGRDPNRHVGFGGGGPHYCLGASLARTQLRAILVELLRRLPDIEAGEPEPMVGNLINGIKRMPCRFTPAA